MAIWIKICGLTDARAVSAAAECGVDAAGFVFAPSAREIGPEAAAALASALPASVKRVAVTRHPDAGRVTLIRERFRPDIWQSDAEDLAKIELPEDCRALPVWRAGFDESAAPPAWLLVEGPASGRGERVDWALAARLAKRARVVLAGGLDAGNVAAAIRRVRPFGVDVSSGVESAPGVKDPDRIRAFVAAVRVAERQL
ncbi:MAG TPA: phosphoribosylanthranilate isomerase [Gammaproteobacteria bacterium]|nr:phosphoribosylanthranilate isomerase [Gammaproteobacteria bacterium]